MKNKLYLCLFGCGKTYFCKQSAKWLDFDVGTREKPLASPSLLNVSLHKQTIDTPNAVMNISDLSLDLLIQYNLKLYFDIKIILPENTTEMKQEILERVSLRPDHDTAFIDYAEANYDSIYALADTLEYPKIYLKSGQYLADIIDEDGKPKPGVIIIYIL